MLITRRQEIRAVASNALRQADVVDDLLQDAYLKLAEGAIAANVSNPFGYCCQVVRHLAMDHHRHCAMEKRYKDRVVDQGATAEMDAVEPEHVVEGREVLNRVDQMLEGFPARTRQAFEWHRLDGLPQCEIAKRLGVSPPRVNFLLNKVLRALQACRE